jgi:[ribosomal protein S5]-alanine N-acetyltransferase
MLTLDLADPPELITARLRLRAPLTTDAPSIFALRSDPTTMSYVPRPLAGSVEDARILLDKVQQEMRENKGRTWAITRTGRTEALGLIGILRLKPEHYRAEVGYSLRREHWGKGYMSEALAAVAEHAFRILGFHSIEAVVDPRNIGSIRVLERNGFVREGLFKENFFHNGEFLDSGVYSLLAPRT